MAVNRFENVYQTKPISQYVPMNLPWEQVGRTVMMKDAQQESAMKRAREEMGTSLAKLEDFKGADNVSVVDDSGNVRNIFIGGSRRVNAIKNNYYNKVNAIAQKLATTDLTSGTSDIADDIFNLKREINAQTSEGGELYVHDKLRSDIEAGWGVVQENWGEVKKDPSVAYDYNRFASNIAGQYANLGDDYSALTTANMKEIFQNPVSHFRNFGAPTGSQPGASDATDVREKLYGYLDKIETQGVLTPPTATSNGMWKYGKNTYRSEDLVKKLAEDVLISNPEIREAFQNRAQMKGMFKGALPEGMTPEQWLQGEISSMIESAGSTFKKFDPSVSYRAMPSGWGYTPKDLSDVGNWSSVDAVVNEDFADKFPDYSVLGKFFPNGIPGERKVAIAAPASIKSEYVPMDKLRATTNHKINFEGEDKNSINQGASIAVGERGAEGYALTNAKGVVGYIPVNNSGETLTVNGVKVKDGDPIPEKHVEAFAEKYSGRGDVVAFRPYVVYSGTPVMKVDGVEKKGSNRVEMFSIPETESEFGAVLSGEDALRQADKSRAKLEQMFNLNPNASTIIYSGGGQPQSEQQGGTQESTGLDFGDLTEEEE